jgi:ABC-type glycerol-3-phosphate transport system substrate-binding protein
MDDHVGDLAPVKPAQNNTPDDDFRFKISLQTLALMDRPETNSDAAQDFVEFFMTSDDYWDFFHGTPLSTMPPTPSLIRSEGHMDNELIQKHKEIAEFSARQLETNQAQSYLVRWGGVNLNYAQMHNNGVWGSMLFRVLEDGQDPATAVDTAVQEMNSYEG